ncbi:MAG: hypothetical protein O7C65_06205, partial [Planctomycetota bacterium]|nr:hypothetical protein [Planctomycetota bacterium]
TAEARIFDEPDSAKVYIRAHDEPCVVKASGLAAGKGAIVCDTPAEALQAVDRILVRREFGSAGATATTSTWSSSGRKGRWPQASPTR